ncbi:MAG TPA: hypothetical protein VKV23_01085 [Acidimicrobiales bacterium]|nr:hypothetical protein [Acidimicrobiales bacterium]
MPVTELRMISAAVPELDAASAAWAALSGHELRFEGPLDEELPTLWGLPTATGSRQAVFGAPGSRRGLVRFLSTDEAARRSRPVERLGPFAIEFFSREVDEVAARATPGSAFALRSPPTAYDLQAIGSGACRSLALQGPGDLWMFVTTLDWVPPPRPLPRVPDLVGPAVNAPIAAVDRAGALRFWHELLGMAVRFDGVVGDPHVNAIMLAPAEWEFRISVFSLGDGQMVEHHFHPPGRLGGAAAPGRSLLPGVTGYTFAASRLDELLAAARQLGVATRGPARCPAPPYEGRRVACLVDPTGALVELVEEET